MIPAVLSCLYVLYLYRKLQDETRSDTEANSPNDSLPVPQRLALVEDRLSKLVASNSAKGDTP